MIPKILENANSDNNNKQEKPPAIESLKEVVLDFVGSLPVRLIIIFIIGTFLAPFFADFIYPNVVHGYSQIAGQLADDAKGGWSVTGTPTRVPPTHKILEAFNKYNLAWYYLTTNDGTLISETKQYAPDLQRYDIQSRSLEWREKHYFEAVAAVGDGKLLHVGFYQGPIMAPSCGQGDALSAIPVNIGYLWTVIGLLCALSIVTLFIFVSKPLGLIYRATSSLLLARDAYSGVTGGGLNASEAVSEVSKLSKGLKNIRRQYDELVAARIAKEEQMHKQRAAFEKEKQSLSKEFEVTLSSTQAKISELYTKEAEEEFINGLGKELDALKSSHQICQRILDKLSDKFPTSILFGAFFKADRYQRLNLDAWLGFDEKTAKALRKVDHARIARDVFANNKYMTLDEESVKDSGLDLITEPLSLRTAVYLPVIFQNHKIGILAIYFNTEGQTVQDRLRVLRNVVELSSRVLHQAIQYEEEQEASRTDSLTGLRNKKCFYETMSEIMDHALLNPEKDPFSLMMLDGDNFKSINDSYGHQTGDQILQELAKIMRSSIRTSDPMDRGGLFGDCLFRYGGEEFIILLEKTDKDGAMRVAERIRKAVEDKNDWPAGIAKCSISIGVATFPGDGKTTDELINKADTALYYVKEELGRNKVWHSSQVPKSYKSSKSSAVVGGELGVFEPAALLQSLATSQKTGILTVQGPDGRQLWMLFENGKPIQARMGTYAGVNAVVEFISTFEDGNFNFQEKATVGKEAMAKLPKLDESFNVAKSLERLLMDGALAQDNYNSAKAVITNPQIIIKASSPAEFATNWQKLSQLPEPPTPEELSLMSDIVEKADGRTALQSILRSMDTIPTHLLWRASQMLIQNNLIKSEPAEAKLA